MPVNVTLSADELKALLAMREEHAALQRERDELRGTLRLVTAERDLAEERLRAYRRELFRAKSEARDPDQLGLFNEAGALASNALPGDWPLSNNACENAIGPFCVGRRSWLFADTVAGANASANLYSVVDTCRANRIDPYRYLHWLFQQLPLAKTVDEYDALLPWKMPANLR